MNYEAVRVDLATAIQAAVQSWVGPPSPLLVTYDNRDLVDQDKVPPAYVCAEIHFLDGGQISLGKTKVVDTLGQVHIVVHVPAGSGTSLARKIQDHFAAALGLKNFTVARTHAAKPAAEYVSRGWVCYPVIIPFWAHHLVTA